MEQEPQKLYTVKEAAIILKMSTRTLWRWIDLGYFNFLVIVPRVERRRVLFSQRSFDDFHERFSSNALKEEQEEKPKRVYNRTAKKYARKKATGKRKKAA